MLILPQHLKVFYCLSKAIIVGRLKLGEYMDIGILVLLQDQAVQVQAVRVQAVVLLVLLLFLLVAVHHHLLLQVRVYHQVVVDRRLADLVRQYRYLVHQYRCQAQAGVVVRALQVGLVARAVQALLLVQVHLCHPVLLAGALHRVVEVLRVRQVQVRQAQVQAEAHLHLAVVRLASALVAVLLVLLLQAVEVQARLAGARQVLVRLHQVVVVIVAVLARVHRLGAQVQAVRVQAVRVVVDQVQVHQVQVRLVAVSRALVRQAQVVQPLSEV